MREVIKLLVVIAVIIFILKIGFIPIVHFIAAIVGGFIGMIFGAAVAILIVALLVSLIFKIWF